jgi:hypothetical protein
MSDEMTLEQAKKRIAELSEMLNNASDEASVRVADERDACERKILFLIETAEEGRDLETTPESIGTDGYLRGLNFALDVIKARKDPGVRAVDEMANGTMIGEFIEAQVTQAVEREIAREKVKWKAVDDAWRGFWTRGGSSPGELRDRGCGASAWLLEQLSAAFKVIDGRS